MIADTSLHLLIPFFFFFNDTPPTEISPLPLHAALPISDRLHDPPADQPQRSAAAAQRVEGQRDRGEGEDHETEVVQADRSEEHTSELQSLAYLVCRLLLEKKKKTDRKK